MEPATDWGTQTTLQGGCNHKKSINVGKIEVVIVAAKLSIMPDECAFCRIYVYKHYINQVNYKSEEKSN